MKQDLVIETPTPLGQRNEQTGRVWSIKKYGPEWQIWDGVGPIAIVSDQSDAELMTAAPELLEACKFFLRAIADGDIVRDISKDASPEWALKMMKFVSELQKAEIAVAKAEGK